MTHALVESLSQRLAQWPQGRFVVAFSGGLDSTVLLHALTQTQYKARLKAIHVHHGLQDVADDWLTHCEQFSRSLDVAFEACRVLVPSESGLSLEARARDARYRALSDSLQSGDVLLTAHHAEDQAETLLLNLMRGSGVEGLSAMPELKALSSSRSTWHGRPLLNQSKADLQSYARQFQLQWVEDHSNRDEQFDRNYLRHRVMPLLQHRWPKAAESMSASVRHLQSVRQRELDYWHQMARLHTRERGKVLPLSALEGMAKADRLSLIRAWLAGSEPAPRYKILQAIDALCYSESGERQEGAGTVAWGKGQRQGVSRFQKALYWRIALDQTLGSNGDWEWQTQDELMLPSLQRPLSQEWCEEQGIAIKPNQTLRVCFRASASAQDRIIQPRKGVSQTQKAYFQEQKVPPWLRDGCPYLYDGAQLIGILIDWGRL